VSERKFYFLCINGLCMVFENEDFTKIYAKTIAIPNLHRTPIMLENIDRDGIIFG